MKFFTFLATLIVMYALLAPSYADEVDNEGNGEQPKEEPMAEQEKAEDLDMDKQPEKGEKPETEKNENDKQSKNGENSEGKQEVSKDKDEDKDYLIDGIKHTKTGIKELFQSFKNQNAALFNKSRQYFIRKIQAFQKALENRREHVKERNERFFNRLREIKDALMD